MLEAMKLVRFLQVVLIASIPFAWLSHLYGSGPAYVHLDVAILITVFASLGAILTEIGLRQERKRMGNA